eukprot:SAG11_NODE_3157_length_2644_cov_2.227112_1_plen_415_part_00
MEKLLEAAAIVIDAGSRECRVGLSGDDAPSCSFLNGVGRSKLPPAVLAQIPGMEAAAAGVIGDMDGIGDMALKLRQGMLTLHCPVVRGVITNWDDMERIWRHSFQCVGVAPDEQPVILVEPPLNPKATRERTARVFFEVFKVPALFTASSAALTLQTLSSCPLSGVVLESGDGVTCATPVCCGHPIAHAIQRLDLAGNELTDWMEVLLHQSGHQDIGAKVWRDVIRDIKEKMCYVALDYEAEVARVAADPDAFAKDYESPGGGPLARVGVERFRCPEALFQPSMVGVADGAGVHAMVHASVSACCAEVRAELWERVVLDGGSMRFPGIAARLQRELEALVAGEAECSAACLEGAGGATPAKVEVKAPLPNVCAWVGGSLSGVLGNFVARCVTRSQYEEGGAGVVHQRERGALAS